MEIKLRKLWPLIGALCVTAFAPSFAQSNYGSSSSGSGSSYGSSMDSSSGQSGQQGTYQRGTFREITPNAGPRVAHGADVFITANFIWWKATQDGLQDAITGVALGDSAALASTTRGIEKGGSVQTPDFKWEPGFKVGLGLNLGHDGWDIFAQYTWFHTGTSSNSTKGIGISNDVAAIASTSFVTSGNIKRSDSWNLGFNVIDLELGRNFYTSQFLTLRPFMGLKGTWQDQDYKFDANPENGARLLGVVIDGLYESRQKHDVWGLGVRAGLNSSWYLSKSWSIYGNVAWSAMWTHYDVDRKDRITLTVGDNAAHYQVVNTNYDAYRVRYVGELELGLRWEMWFYDDNYHFAIQAGWEEQVWINYGSYIRVYNDVQGDLSLHGLNLKFRFDF